MEKPEPVPVAGDPPVAVQEKVNGAVPPVAVAVHPMSVPTVPVEGQLIETASVCDDVIVIVAEFEAVFPLVSVTVTLTVSDPVAENVVENVADVAVVLATELTDHA